MFKFLNRWRDSMLHSFRKGGTRTKCEYDAWRERAQQGELKFHRQNTWRPSEKFSTENRALLEHFGFRANQFAGQTVIDVGAGSKLRTRYFHDARVIAIEPLADRFRAEIEWCDLDDAEAVYSLPAEQFVAECENQADLVFSVNVLDHCFDFERIAENIAAYAKPDGTVFLSFDKHNKADEMHPLELDEEICTRIFDAAGLEVEKYDSGFGTALGGLQTYGHGPYAMNYWLKRKAAA